jgi:energy-coupling factor transporter ATP-binding protein EcfA2
LKLRRLHVRRMPGIHEGFEVDRLHDGLTIVVGANGAGKSTLCRALAALLWPGLDRDDAISVDATFEDGPRAWHARREGTRTGWQCDGREHAAPSYPGEPASRCFLLRFGDLLLPGGATDEAVAREVRRQLAGGFDLHQVSRSEFELAARHGRVEESRLRERTREAQRIRTFQEELGRREDEQRSLERRLAEAQAAAEQLPELREAAALARARARLCAVQAELRGFPPGLDRLHGDERERFRELELERERLSSEIAACRAEIEATSTRIEGLQLAAEERERDARARREIEAFVARQRALFRGVALALLAAAPVVAWLGRSGAAWALGLAGAAIVALTLVWRRNREVAESAGLREALAHELEALLERARSETARTPRLEKMLEHNVERSTALWSACGLAPGDAAELGRRLDARERHRRLAVEAERLALTIGEIEARVGARLAAYTLEELEVEIAAAESLGAAHTELARASGALEAEVGQARRGNVLERALAEVASAREALSRRRDEALAAACGRFWIEQLASETDLAYRPRLLARAQSLFARFTQHRYALQLTEGPAPAFRAVEVETGDGRSLAELSDATRVQLLLAARLAYVEQVDPDARLPLVLDEVLATSDPERFEAVASALLPLAAEQGRQVLYASADPADRGRFDRVLRGAGLPEAAIVDLDVVRGLGTRVRGRTTLEVPPLPDVPAPGTLAAEDYGERLGVPSVDPRRPVGSLHLFHLLRDDLRLLHALLRERIATVGQWRLLVSSGAARHLVGEAAAERISALADVAEELFGSWRIGRGRPVDAAVLRRAGLGETWVARLASLAEEAEGDAATLLARLERRDDERARGFQSRLRERLREHLLDEGYLDEREPLDEPTLHARVRSGVERHVEAGRLGAGAVPLKVHELLHQGRVHLEGRKP